MLRSFALAALLFSFAGAAVALTGCGNGVATQLPSGTAIRVHESSSGSWMDPTAKAENLIYVSTFPYQGKSVVEVYSWAKREYVGMLTDAVNPRFLCSDKAGNVFVTDYDTSQIFEYAHGGTSPIAILKDEGHSPRACGSDGVTGDLAVVDADDIAIYRNASGDPTRYTDVHFAKYRFCGYDDKGNLLVDGTKPSEHEVQHFILAELPKGGKSLTEISLEPLNFIPNEPGSVQWDGKYMAVGDAWNNTANQFKITGSTGSHQGTAHLDLGEGLVQQFWIPKFGNGTRNPQASQIVAAQFLVGSRHDPGDIGFWDYPNGGVPKHLLVSPDHPDGITVSILRK
jgi:hypothetical protein